MENNSLEVKINITTNVSLWQAIKLRIAGGEYIQEFFRRELEQSAERLKRKEVSADDIHLVDQGV